MRPARIMHGLVRRIRDLARGETAATYFDPFDRRDLTQLLAEFNIPLPGDDPTQADENVEGAGRFLIGTWHRDHRYRRRFPDAFSGPEAGALTAYLKSPAGESLWKLSQTGRRNLFELFAQHPFDRVRQIYELRADVREVFPLGLTPAQRGDYTRWLLRYARREYGLTDVEILWYLFGLAEDPSYGLVSTYRLSPKWQEAIPDALTPEGWDHLKTWLVEAYPARMGRWLRHARLLQENITEPSPEPAINILGHFKYESGLQEEAVRHADVLKQSGYRVRLRDVPVSYPRVWNDECAFTELETGPITLIKTGANDPLDEVYYRAGLHPRAGVYRIACWSWELEAFPRHAVERGGLADEVWTPSEFCARSVRAALPGKPVFAMPPAVAVPVPEVRPRSAFGLPADHFLFLFMFDMASGMERKNPLGLIRAFREAFHPTERVHLAIKVSRGSKFPEEFKALQAASAHAGVTLIDRVMAREEVCALIASCDAYVSLHRAEGFGFTMAEAMLLGKPTIATDYSGNLDFMAPDNSYLVRQKPVTLDRDYPPYPKGAVWADPDEEHAAELMIRVCTRRDEASAVATRGRETVATLLSSEAAARRMRIRLEEIYAR